MIELNDRWRVSLDNSAQWILQRQQGRNADGSPRYRDRSFCTQCRTLLRCIREDCGEVDPEALRQVEALPEKFPYRKAKSRRVEIGRALAGQIAGASEQGGVVNATK